MNSFVIYAFSNSFAGCALSQLSELWAYSFAGFATSRLSSQISYSASAITSQLSSPSARVLRAVFVAESVMPAKHTARTQLRRGWSYASACASAEAKQYSEYQLEDLHFNKITAQRPNSTAISICNMTDGQVI